MHVCIFICECMNLYVFISIYIFSNTYIHTHTGTNILPKNTFFTFFKKASQNLKHTGIIHTRVFLCVVNGTLELLISYFSVI